MIFLRLGIFIYSGIWFFCQKISPDLIAVSATFDFVVPTWNKRKWNDLDRNFKKEKTLHFNFLCQILFLSFPSHLKKNYTLYWDFDLKNWILFLTVNNVIIIFLTEFFDDVSFLGSKIWHFSFENSNEIWICNIFGFNLKNDH